MASGLSGRSEASAGQETHPAAAYAAKAHPWAAIDEGMLLSYCVNAWEFAQLFRDAEVYRPKFVRVKLLPSK
jgi:hypothetical protein